MAIEQFIDNEVKGNDVVLFMKGTPQFPMCGFSGQVVQILDHLGVTYKGLNVLESDDLRDGIKSYSNWPTIPQLYVKGEFVGGCDIIREMFQAGELQGLLKDKGVPVKEARAGVSTLESGTRDCRSVPDLERVPDSVQVWNTGFAAGDPESLQPRIALAADIARTGRRRRSRALRRRLERGEAEAQVGAPVAHRGAADLRAGEAALDLAG